MRAIYFCICGAEQEHSLLGSVKYPHGQGFRITSYNVCYTKLLRALSEAVYVGNSALKTEFSFGSDDRHAAQHIVVSTVEPGKDRTVKITGYNYTDDYYLYDGVPAQFGGFSNGFSNGFN